MYSIGPLVENWTQSLVIKQRSDERLASKRSYMRAS